MSFSTRLRWVTVGLVWLSAACSSRPAVTPTATPIPPAVVTAVQATTSTLVSPTPTLAEDTADAPETAVIEAFLATAFEGEPFRGAVLVARQGEVILRRGYGLADAEHGIANAPETRFRLGSVTKPITALAVLTLQAAGKLAVQQSVCAYLSDCPTAWQSITLHHLLSHTSGIPDFTRFPDYELSKGQPSTPTQTITRFAGRPLDCAPGTRWD